MQYGYFDDPVKEYVITRPDTPQSWSNYLGSTEFGAIITNNAGGYGFFRSGARGRFLRLRFNSVPMDQPGRYFYIRDRENGDFWSASWQPVGKPLGAYQSTCRHGTAYTVIESDYASIHSESTYFVPLGQKFEYWRLKLTNQGDQARELSVFSYCEFTNQWDTYQDQVNLQYSMFITKGELTPDNLLRIAIQDNLTSDQEEISIDDIARHMWMGLAGSTLDGYDTSRAAFIGLYHGYHNPQAVVQGYCSGSRVYGENACGVLQSDISLQPGESRELLILLGIGDARTTGRKTMLEFGSLEKTALELEALKDDWHGRLDQCEVITPDEEFNHMVNIWGPYNSLITFNWSRAASLVYNGERDGLGFRDSVQDVLGVVPIIPEAARKRLELLLTGQYSNGGAMPIVQPYNHHPGSQRVIREDAFRSDDCLWFFNSIPAYVNETGDLDFYRKILPFADRGEASVLGHLRRALEFNLERTGKHGLPCGLAADWNDCLRLGYRGESLMVAFQVCYGLAAYAEIACQLGETAEAVWAINQRQMMAARIAQTGWDGGWFIWAVAEDGTVYGTRAASEGQLYLNTQVWSVISKVATTEQAEQCMQAVKNRLATPYGIMLCAPPFKETSIEVMRAVVFNAGIKENAGIFNHTQGWAVMAECLLGHGDQAYAYYRAFMPSASNTTAEIRQSEPYVHAQTTYSQFSARPGNTRVSWLTGAAAWAQYSATNYILGLQPQLNGFKIDPCIPAAWDGYSVKRIFRGQVLNIRVHNPGHVNRAVTRMQVNGQLMQGNFIPSGKLLAQNTVEVWLGDKPDPAD